MVESVGRFRIEKGKAEMNEWLRSTFKVSIQQYALHPELMAPFLIQGGLGLGLSWYVAQSVAQNNPDTEMLEMVFIIVIGVLGLVLQGWALRWCHDRIAGDANAISALQTTLRRWASLLGVSLLVAFPGSLLLMLLLGLTSGWVAAIGMTLAATLVSWVSLFAVTGVVVDRRRAWIAIREGLLLLGVQPKHSLSLFAILLAYGYLATYLNGSNTLLGLEDDFGSVGPVWSALWSALSVLFSPVVYLMAVLFYRDHGNVAEEEALT